MQDKTQKLFRIILTTILLAIITISLGVYYLFTRYNQDLPDYQQLKSYNPLVTTRLYSYDGELIKEFSKENRVFVSIDSIPRHLISAFLAAEDSNFYKHSGIDLGAIIRAAIANGFTFFKGEGISGGGASTITQQVVKNFLLSNEKTFDRKIKEAILAFKITRTFTKDQIMELYLNQIYLGSSAYGVAAAAQVYFDKSIDELTIEEDALLATLPKAPSKLDPRKNMAKAKARRDWVIKRMMENGFITRQEAYKAMKNPIVIKENKVTVESTANSFSDDIKKALSKDYGSDDVFESGIVVRTTLDTKMQKIAGKALQKGIEEYDRRHGYRGPLTKIKMQKDDPNWQQLLEQTKIDVLHKDNWSKAVILSYGNNKAEIGLENSKKGFINLESVRWARKYLSVDALGPKIKQMSDVFAIGDVIFVEQISENLYELRQLPDINGAVMAMDPHTGRVLAMSGGYLDAANQFNRAVQAQRQPGSVLKVFGYIAALENGLTPATIMMDEPITLDQGNGIPYTPENYSGEYYGPITLRKGLEQSINVTTVRIASQVGLDKVAQTIKRFKVNDNPDPIYSLVLGSSETTLSRIVTAYSMIVNGGKEVEPSLIEKIQDRNGKIIYKRDSRPCNCVFKDPSEYEDGKIPFPILNDNRKQITDSATAYQITSMLEGVVKRGTAAKAASLGKVLGGKTGTTNNAYDSWFVGFSPDLVFGVYVGFDIPRTLGRSEAGASVALPIFIEFMKEALKDKPSTPFRVPNTVKFVKIDMDTGRTPTPSTSKNRIISEVFKLNDRIESGNSFINGDEDGNQMILDENGNPVVDESKKVDQDHNPENHPTEETPKENNDNSNNNIGIY